MTEIIFEVAGPNETGGALRHERRRLGLEHFLDGTASERVPVLAAVRNDVEQANVNSGIGEVGGDAGAHHASADDDGLLDRHQAASSMVAIP